MKFCRLWRTAKSEQTTEHDIDLSRNFKQAAVEDIRERAGWFRRLYDRALPKRDGRAHS